MVAIGANRLFAAWIVGGIPPEVLPTLAFVVSLFMALATGTSWGTMAILFPLITVPTYTVADGNAILFYATVAGVLSGSVAGDHMSPISDTTVLSALACDVTLMAHVNTQAPYAIAVVVLSMMVGTIPIGYSAWPNMVGFALGWAVSILFVFFICQAVISPTGRWDIFTKYCCGRGHPPGFLDELAEDCIKKANGEVVTMRTEDDPTGDKQMDPTKEQARDVSSENEESVEEAAAEDEGNAFKEKTEEEIEA
jgi:Na+/H+ antiporter family